jgi:hypothetical protein
MNTLTYITVILSLLAQPLSFAADSTSPLSVEEQSALSKLGIPPEEAKNLTAQNLKKKLQDSINSKIQPNINEIKNTLNKTQEDLKKDVNNIAKGYLASTISLFAAALLAPQVLMVCKTKPSALIYVGTSALYILSEIATLKTLKASQLAEIEVVNDLTIDQNKSVQENVKVVKAKVDAQVGYLKTYKKTLDDYFEALKKKSRNAKMASIGYLAASAAAVAEQMDWISGGGNCHVTNNDVSLKSPQSLVFSKNVDDRYIQFINNAKTNEDKWAIYYEWESYKFGANRSMTNKDYDNFKNIPSNLSEKSLSAILVMGIQTIQNQIVKSAFSEAVASEKVAVAPSLKNDKMADWYGDLDKLGIVGGLATNVVGFMITGQITFLNSIMLSGTSRAITFGVQSALAYTASKMFDDGADGLIEKMALLEKVIDEIDKGAHIGLDALVPGDVDCQHLQEIAAKIGVPSSKLINQMTLREAGQFIEKIKETANDKLNAADYGFINSYADKLQSKSETPVPPTSTPIEKTTSFIDWIFSKANASTEILTRPLHFPKSTHPKMTSFNQYLGIYEAYSEGVVKNNPRMMELNARKLTRNKSTIANFRNELFANKNNILFQEIEKKKIKEYMDSFDNYYSKLSPTAKSEMNNLSMPLSPLKAIEAKPVLDQNDKLVLMNLIKKLESIGAEKTVQKVSLNEPLTREDSTDMTNFDDQFNTIHPKESVLFEIIHVRYLKFIQKNLAE